MPSGYYRYPTIHSDTVVFVCEDDLWSVPATGGVARRLTSNLGEVTRPLLSPDGTQLAFVGREEGQSEIYLMPAVGGQARRLTFMGGTLCLTAGWTRDGKIVFANNAAQPFPALLHLYVVDAEGNPPVRIEVGPARDLRLHTRAMRGPCRDGVSCSTIPPFAHTPNLRYNFTMNVPATRAIVEDMLC